MDTNIIPPQQFYLIQLDQNVPFDPQPMPLHVVENVSSINSLDFEAIIKFYPWIPIIICRFQL